MSFLKNKKNTNTKIAVPEIRKIICDLIVSLLLIGVLAVCAISGYSRAMMKYRLNKQTTQISAVLDYLTLNYSSNMHLDNYKEYQLTPLLRKLNVIPDDMIKTSDDTYIYDVFGTLISVENHRTVDDDSGLYLGFYITDDRLSAYICLNIYTIAKENARDLSFSTVNRRMENDTLKVESRYLGDSIDNKSPARYLKNITKQDIDRACNLCKKVSKCIIGIGHGYRKI